MVIDKHVVFEVWNEGLIPEEVQYRIFTRSFTTKSEPGHGLGTYSMKLFGEKYLKGKISFHSTDSTGTVFRYSLPINTQGLANK